MFSWQVPPETKTSTTDSHGGLCLRILSCGVKRRGLFLTQKDIGISLKHNGKSRLHTSFPILIHDGVTYRATGVGSITNEVPFQYRTLFRRRS